MNRNFLFATILAAIGCNFLIISCHRMGDNEKSAAQESAREAAVPDTTVNPYENASVEIKTFQNDSAYGGFGYDVYINNTMYVHQPNIPAVPGNKGFVTEEKAKRAGELVSYKIKHNIMPPSVTPKELDSLGVLN